MQRCHLAVDRRGRLRLKERVEMPPTNPRPLVNIKLLELFTVNERDIISKPVNIP